ncbi:MAG: HEAT repeat domain-containing protein [Minicystis sp.]
MPALAYTDLVADVLLTARKLEKHLGSGEPLDPRHVEELVGKTWQKTDLEALSGLDLIEYAYQTRVTSDQFVIYESRFLDLVSGTHYSEKVISPLAFRSNDGPKPSRAGAVLAGLRGGRYPGYPPFRLKISDLGDRQPIDHAALSRLVERALPDVGSALAALAEHRRDVFAPDLLPVSLRVDTLFARGGRMQAVDAEGHALHLPDAPALEDRLGSALGGAKLVALLGDLGIEAALPTIFPLAAIVEGPLGFELRALAGNDAGVPKAAAPEAGSAAWIRAAREAGASAAAIALAEVREALADAFVVGLAALTPRAVDPLETRLRDLGLEKQAALLHGIAAAPVEARLDDFVKLYQVLGIALVRLAGATEVDRATLMRVPTYESVFVKKPEAWLDPDRTGALRLAGTIGRYEAAVQYAHHYEGLPKEQLAASIYPTWADGSASPYVVRAFAGRREEALAAAKKALSGKGGRVAKITALRVLAAAGGLEAERILHEVMTTERDIGMRALAADARDAIETRTLGPQAVQRRRAPLLEKVAEATNFLVSASRKEERAAAITRLVQLGHLSAIPALRQAFLTDAAQDVREEAALGIALLGDTEMVDTFVSMLRRRGEDDREAKVAADALGVLGDVRGLRELLAAFSEGYKPGVIAEALRSMGPVALDPLLGLIETQPKLAERQATKSVLEQLPDRDLAAALVARVRGRAGAADLQTSRPST